MFGVFGSHVFLEPREEALTVVGDYAEQSRPVTLAG